MNDLLKDILSKSIVEVTFTKLDGTERVMLCTTSPEFIPNEDMPIGSGKSKTDGVTCVYDIENNGWRSFHNDRVIRYIPLEKVVVK